MDLAVTALKERSTMLARNAYLPVESRIVARLMVAIVLLVVTVAVASLAKTPQYESSAIMLVGQEQDTPPFEVEELQGFTHALAATAHSRIIAKDVIERLGLSTKPEVLLERLEAETIENTQFIEISYTDPDPERAQRVANAVGDVLSRRISERDPNASAITATLWERAPAPMEPVSPNPLRNGLLTLVLGLMLCVGLALAWPRVAASSIGQTAHRVTRTIGQAASGARGTPAISPITETAKEKELLQALGRCGELTVAGAALETSLSVEEAERVLSGLAAKSHLRVRVRDGGLFYSFWQPDTPE